MKKFSIVLGLLLVSAMILGACQPAPEPAAEAPAAEEAAPAEEEAMEEDAAMTGEDFDVCLVTDSAGIGDKSFNDAVWMGLEKAMTDFGIKPITSSPRAQMTTPPTCRHVWILNLR